MTRGKKKKKRIESPRTLTIDGNRLLVVIEKYCHRNPWDAPKRLVLNGKPVCQRGVHNRGNVPGGTTLLGTLDGAEANLQAGGGIRAWAAESPYNFPLVLLATSQDFEHRGPLCRAQFIAQQLTKAEAAFREVAVAAGDHFPEGDFDHRLQKEQGALKVILMVGEA